MLEIFAQSPSPSPSEGFIESEAFRYLFDAVIFVVGGIAGFLGKMYLDKRNRESEAAARQEERAHQRDVAREERQAKRHEEELKDWQELIADLRTLLRSDYSQYDDPERTKRAREEWDRNLERRLTALAPFTANIPARKISHRLRVEFHRLRETTFFFQNKDHTDPRWEEQYARFDVAWNEALFLIGKLIEALGGEPAESRKNWPANLRHDDDERDRRDFYS